MATTAPISPRRDAKINPEPKRIKEFAPEAPPLPGSPAESNLQTATESENTTEQPVALAPDHEAIARLAYGYWLDRQDSGDGSPDQDWFRAEQELRSR